MDFRHYLSTVRLKSNGEKLKPNTAYTYFNKVKAALENAFEEELLLSKLENAPPINSEADIRLLIDWLNLNGISASTLITGALDNKRNGRNPHATSLSAKYGS